VHPDPARPQPDVPPFPGSAPPPPNAGPGYPLLPVAQAVHRPVWPWIVAMLAAAVAAVVVTVAAMTTLAGDNGGNAAAPVEAGPVEEVADSPTPAPVITPELDRLQLTPKIKERQCFGSAGCNITFVVEAGWDVTLDPNVTWEVTYEVTGVEDGPLIGTFEITGDRYEQSETSAQVPKASTKLRVRATGISRVGF
jgi:hypothetical protein